MKKNRYEVILAGSGGQGLVVSGIMLAEAAMLEDKNVVQTVSYGIATRGGFSMAEVIIDTEEIIFQQVREPDVVLVLTGEAMEKFEPAAGRGASIFYDTTLLDKRSGQRLFGHPFTEMAERIGHVGTANTIALGCISRMTGMVGEDSLAKVVKDRFSGKVSELNLEALRQGAGLAT